MKYLITYCFQQEGLDIKKTIKIAVEPEVWLKQQRVKYQGEYYLIMVFPLKNKVIVNKV